MGTEQFDGAGFLQSRLIMALGHKFMLKKLHELSNTFKRELGVYRAVLRDKRTPKLATVFLGLAVGYLLMPFDLIPDFIPILGQVDDLVIVPCLVIIALKLIPKEIIAEHKAKAA